jgi:hypothetical protein
MTGVLKVLLWIYGILLVVGGLSLIFVPEWLGENAFNIENITGITMFFAPLLGAIYIAAGIWLAAAGRQPLQNISWLKFVILKTGLSTGVMFYVIMREYMDFSATTTGLLIYEIVFCLVFLIFYPWKVKNRKPEAT